MAGTPFLQKNDDHDDHAELADLLRTSIRYVTNDDFHPVLYHAMSGLRQYIGRHQARLIANPEVTLSNGNEGCGTSSSDTNSSCSEKSKDHSSPVEAGSKLVNRGATSVSGGDCDQQGDSAPSDKLPLKPDVSIKRTNPANSISTLEPESNQIAEVPLKGSTLSPKSSGVKTDHQPSAEVLLEQEKQLAAERHRRNVELQRKLSRAEWKKKDLENKLKFLSQEERKLRLAASSQQPGSISFANASESLQQTLQQVTVISKQITEQETAVVAIKAELHAFKNQQKPSTGISQTDAKQIADEQRRRQERQKKLENDLEARKRATAEKRRKELEEGRRRAREEQKRMDEETKRKFFEKEKRKQDLKEQAKARQRGSGTNKVLREKLSTHLSALDAEFSSQRKEEKDENAKIFVHETEKDLPNAPSSFEDFQPAPANGYRQTIPIQSKDARDAQSAHSDTNHPDFRFGPCRPEVAPRGNGGLGTQPKMSQPTSLDRSGKYAKLAETAEDKVEEFNMSELKRLVIVQWALQPPHLQGLRPLGELLSTIHYSFPPAHNLAPHSYFEDWDVISESTVLSEKQLNKAVRRVRFFLHPDRLPRDFTDRHLFLCKLLWDVINDAWEEHKRVKEDLGWLQS